MKDNTCSYFVMPGVGPGQCEEPGAGPAPGQVDTGEPGVRGPGADPLQVTITTSYLVLCWLLYIGRERLCAACAVMTGCWWWG